MLYGRYLNWQTCAPDLLGMCATPRESTCSGAGGYRRHLHMDWATKALRPHMSTWEADLATKERALQKLAAVKSLSPASPLMTHCLPF